MPCSDDIKCRVGQSRLGGRPAQCIERLLGTVHTDDDRAAHLGRSADGNDMSTKIPRTRRDEEGPKDPVVTVDR